MFKLGDTLRDTVTGFTGVATSRVEYLNGCVQFCIKPQVDKDGKMVDGEYVDDGQLEVVVGIGAGTDDSFPLKETGGLMPDTPPEAMGR